ncbi:MAG: hypothetical protein ACRC1M_07465 [Methanobacteriaceae archaeon]
MINVKLLKKVAICLFIVVMGLSLINAVSSEDLQVNSNDINSDNGFDEDLDDYDYSYNDIEDDYSEDTDNKDYGDFEDEEYYDDYYENSDDADLDSYNYEDEDYWDEEYDDEEYYDGEDEEYWDDDEYIDDDYYDEEEDNYNYYEWVWKGEIYYIDLDEFNLTDDELTELFTKRDILMEEIENLEFRIAEMEKSRNSDILLTIDELVSSMDNIPHNTEFSDLALSLKNISISEINSTFNDLKTLLLSLKAQNPHENFTEIDIIMDKLEIMLNTELETYENLSSELREKKAELYELFEKYPFLAQNTKYIMYNYASSRYGNSKSAGDSDNSQKTANKNNIPNNIDNIDKASATMAKTGIPYFPLAIIMLLCGLFGFNIRRIF